MARTATIERNTKETQISVQLDLDGGEVQVNTGIGFFDHMLTAFGFYAGIGLKLTAKGDLYVDGHHTVEDTGIVLGMALGKALGDKSGIERYGSFFVPMDESLSFASVDVSGRPFLVFEGEFAQERVGDFDTCMTEEFFRALAVNAGITLHMKVQYGKNSHHMIEGLFKAAAHALRLAVKEKADGRLLSTKGVL